MVLRALMMTAVSLFALTNAISVMAQSTPDEHTRVSGLFSGLIGDGGRRPGFDISAGHRLNRFAGFEFDAGFTSRLSLGEETRNLIILAGGAP